MVGSNYSNKFTEIIEFIGAGLRQTEAPQNDPGRPIEGRRKPIPHATCDHRGSYVRGLGKGIQSTDHDCMSVRPGNCTPSRVDWRWDG